jgi:cytochrome c553
MKTVVDVIRQSENKLMRRSVWLLLISLLPVAAHAADRPDWAFPVTDAVQPATPKQDDQPKTLAGSTKSYTAKQIDDLSNPPDWFPDMHPPMPQVVAHGTATFACGSCHLPTGTGHDESAYLAGLPAPYIAQQMADFKSGARKGFGEMPAIAQALTDADFQSATAYFASLPVRPWVRVVERPTRCPRLMSRPAIYGWRFPAAARSRSKAGSSNCPRMSRLRSTAIRDPGSSFMRRLAA